VHVQNPLADALHWRRPDFGPAVGDVLAAIAREGRGALVLLGDHADANTLLTRVRALDAGHEEPTQRPSRGHALAEWRRNGAGAQILADLGLGKLRVLGTPRKQIGLAGFGLEVVEYVEPPH
jgi:3,4-dihydroxy 2-butanone 4-phosphate synthase/GTP cyclohydrolase II